MSLSQKPIDMKKKRQKPDPKLIGEVKKIDKLIKLPKRMNNMAILETDGCSLHYETFGEKVRG